MQDILIGVDFEGRSRLDITEVGATKYATDPSSSPICLGYANMSDALRGEKFVNIWKAGTPFPSELAHYADMDGVVFVAHNSQFDRTYWSKQITPVYNIPVPRRWLCTAVRASANGLPRSLDEACAALGLPGKDKDGQKALKRLYAPDKKTGKFIMPADAPDLYDAAYGYCRVDIQRMFQLLQGTRPISPADQLYFELDQRINERGFAIDGDSLDRMLEVLELCQADLTERAARFGLSMTDLNSPKALHDIMELYGFSLPNLQAQTIDDALETRHIPPDVREMLTLRRLAGLKSPGKLRAFKQYGDYDPSDNCYTIRDAYIMHGAHTGRHTSQGAQAQNLKRDCANQAEMNLLLDGDLEAVKLLSEEPLKLIGKAIRPLIRARGKRKLLIGDFSKIETCVLFWLAREIRGLKMLEQGVDLYCDLASSIYGRKITKSDVDERQLGKQGILGCGYGIGHVKFQATCAKYGIEVDLETCLKTVTTYREVYKSVKSLWYNFDTAIGRAIGFKGKPVPQQLGFLKIIANDKQLVVVLPSSRKLRYAEPQLKQSYEGDVDLTIRSEQSRVRYRPSYMRVDPKTHQWRRYETWGGSFTENVVQAIANDLQREAALRLEDAGFDIVLHSHDELVAEADESRLDEFLTIMSLKSTANDWWNGIPITVDGKATRQYRK